VTRLTFATRKLIAGLLVLLLALLAFSALFPYLQLEFMQAQRQDFLDFYAEEPGTVMLLYVAVTATCIGLSLPATGIFALLAGAVFGFGVGVVLCAIASMIGSVIAFLWARYLFRDWVQARFGRRLATFNRGIEREGGYYLFTIRLLMVLPFFLVNVLCGVTSLRLGVYIIATLASHTIVIAVWVYAGAALATLESPADVLSLEVFGGLALIGLTPLLLHRLVLRVRNRRSRSH
jgi:uncharacterized membrane protein YdjX (TVP38/TMEM64 family)